MLCVAFLKSGPGGAERKVVIKCIPKPQNIYNHRKIIWQTCGMSEKVQVEVGNCFDKLFNPLQLRIVLYILCFIYCIGNRDRKNNANSWKTKNKRTIADRSLEDNDNIPAAACV